MLTAMELAAGDNSCFFVLIPNSPVKWRVARSGAQGGANTIHHERTRQRPNAIVSGSGFYPVGYLVLLYIQTGVQQRSQQFLLPGVFCLRYDANGGICSPRRHMQEP